MAPDSETGAVMIWDARLATVAATIDKPTQRAINCVAHSPQRGIALTCSPDMTVAFWSTATQAPTSPPPQTPLSAESGV